MNKKNIPRIRSPDRWQSDNYFLRKEDKEA
jgi:hypothetical protein